ncbi:MAG: cellulase family glycosylhydrolase [Cyclobacteriaceae bacterium]|nr:cellulase family glycosylhydrolase [Cyclobacteriaceae bacterium]
MNTRITIISAILFVCLSNLLFAQAQPLPRIQVTGNIFTDDKGEPIVFRGINTSDPYKLKQDNQWNKRYFQEIKNWGANAVRFPVHPENWRTMGKESYLKLLDEGVQWATELQMYVIIDWHSIGNLKTELFFRPSYNTTIKETLEFWQIIAKHYGKNTTVAFFELFNEPVNNGEFGSCTWAEWKAIMEETIAVIRAEEAINIPLVGGFDWGYDLIEAGADPVDAEGIGYTSHPYPMKREKPWEDKWTQDWGFMAERYPVMLTEIGFSGEEEKGAHVPVISDESYGDAITAYCKQKGVSYIVWCFDPDWGPMLIRDWDFNTTRQGKYFKQALSGK